MNDVPRSSLRRFGPLAAAVAIGIGSVALAASFKRPPPAPETLPPGIAVHDGGVALADGAPQWTSIRLGTAAPAGAHYTDAIPARVSIDESRASRIGAPLAGRVVAVHAELGASVAAGARLFTVASPDLASLRAELSKADVELEAARKSAARASALLEAKAIAEKDAQAAADTLTEAQLARDLAARKLDALHVVGSSPNEYDVTAPRDGVVVAKNVLPSQQVGPDVSADPSMVIADLGSVWVLADVFEADAAGLAPGTRAEVTTALEPGESYETVVDQVGAVVDPERHAIPVRLSLANPARHLKPNVHATVRFEVAASASPEIDATALVSDGAREYVYVRGADGAFRRRNVTTGPVRNGRVAVRSGLTAGETVAFEGALLLDNQLSLAD